MADKSDKPKQPQKYFWSAILDKRKAKKANVRESSMPKQPTSREDKLRLIGCGAIIGGIILMIVIMNIVGSANAAKKKEGRLDFNPRSLSPNIHRSVQRIA